MKSFFSVGLQNGMRVVVRNDIPRIQLGIKPCVTKFGDSVDWVSPDMRDEVNEWLKATFGSTNLLKDGECIVMEAAGQIHMNERTYRQFKQTTTKEGGQR